MILISGNWLRSWKAKHPATSLFPLGILGVSTIICLGTLASLPGTQRARMIPKTTGSVSIGLLKDRRTTMSTPEILLQTLLHNEKQRYQFSMPIYKKAEPRRATGRSRASGQIFYHAEVYIRAVQGHSVSSSPMASLELITRDNLPNNAVHGTNIQAAKSIAKYGMIPGGGEGKRQANHFACTLPNDVSTVVSGYRSTSQVCFFLCLPKWIENGKWHTKAPMK